MTDQRPSNLSTEANIESEFSSEWKSIQRRREVAFGIGGPAEPQAADAQSSTNSDSSAVAPEVSVKRPKDLVGLALSGGGLRSAIFNDGFLQALSHRGLLRYVDYLCSVSGGGYIAGHLMTYTQPKAKEAEKSATSPANFHTQPDVWSLGRDPLTGKEDASRLTGVGVYLNRTIEFFAGYLLRQLPAFVLYLSFVGIIGTLLALYFRSFDAPVFRVAFIQGYGVRFGSELFIAFLPTLMIGACYLLIAALIWFIDLITDASRMKFLVISSRVTFWTTVLCAMTSVAVFMGNDLTRATSNRDVANSTQLNGFAVQLTIIAAIVQILVFLGRDRLFRSEKSESSRWQKLAQSLIANGVVGFLIFAMIHVMASENISGYTYTRDPYLVEGEVSDWRFLVGVFAELPPKSEDTTAENASRLTKAEDPNAILAKVDFDAWAADHRIGLSTAHRHSTFALNPEDISIPRSPASRFDSQRGMPMNPFDRLSQVSWLCSVPMSLTQWMHSQKEDSNQEGPVTVARTINAVEQFQANQRQYLADHNALMESEELTKLLLSQLTTRDPAQAKPSFDAKQLSHSSFGHLVVQEHLQPRIESLSLNRRANLERRLNNHDLRTLASSSLRMSPTAAPSQNTGWSTWTSKFESSALSNSNPVTEQTTSPTTEQVATKPKPDSNLSPNLLERVYLNRELLELCGEHEAVLKPMDVASTPVIQPHDQAARKRWLTFWTLLFGVSLVLTTRLNMLSHLFRFYHRAIETYFLRGKQGFVQGSTAVNDLVPWEAGLPFPIYLAAWLKPSAFPSEGREAHAVAITPQHVTLRDGAAGNETAIRQSSASYHYEFSKTLTLSDAVAVSGAALTPNMTNNPALVVLMDFFGARLGLWFKRPEEQAVQQSRNHSFLVAVVASVLILILNVFVLSTADFADWSWMLIPSIAWWFGICLIFSWGYPGLLLSLWRTTLCDSSVRSPLDFKKEAAIRNDEISKCWPNIFVSDGGFVDFLGVTELLRRRCEYIVVSDAGVNTGSTTLESLAIMCERASSELGVRFIDLDHDAPIEFARLKRNADQYAPQPYFAMRVKYPPSDDPAAVREGVLFYAQMAISEHDPIEIQQIRHRFPSFPDEPTTNQFYTPEQVAAYRNLGYHIGNRLCSQLKRWNETQLLACAKLRDNASTLAGQPMFAEVANRLRRGYLQACFEELYYKKDDVYSESIWRGSRKPEDSRYTSFLDAWSSTLRCKQLDQNRVPAAASRRSSSSNSKVDSKLALIWLDQFTANADVSSRYMEAVNYDVNSLRIRRIGSALKHDELSVTTSILEQLLRDGEGDLDLEFSPAAMVEKLQQTPERWAAHLVAVAAAAQQLHRGTPHTIFQVGGRDKLCLVVSHLVQDLIRVMDRRGSLRDANESATASANTIHSIYRQLASSIIHEVCELTDSIFQSANFLAVVSFTQCLCHELMPAMHYLQPTEKGAETERRVTDQLDRDREFQLALDFRQLMLDALQSGYRSRANELIAAYLQYLSLESDEASCFTNRGNIVTMRNLSNK